MAKTFDNMTAKLINQALNFDKVEAEQKAYTTVKARRIGTVDNKSPRGVANVRIIDITTTQPDNHLRSFRMKTSSLRERNRNTDVVTGFNLDKGIFTSWHFKGSKGADTLTFGLQGHIFSKRHTGTVDFGVDNARDVFTFTNTINIAKCSAKHGFTCSRYNHLSNVKIRNFGREDILNIQGDIYTYNDILKGLPGDLASRLSVELIPDLA